MSILGSSQSLERIQFFNGERLFASDLQALEAFSREMRWLHNQSLHQAGVGSGFQVTGEKGDRQVTISPGYAIDSCGREIVLTEPQVLSIPPVADDGSGRPAFYDLIVSYPDDSELTPSETRQGSCDVPAGVVKLREAPVFCWAELNSDLSSHQPVDQRMKDGIRKALYIVLAQIQIFNCQLKQPVSTMLRRNARAPKQPRIACGMPVTLTWSASNLGAGSTAPGVSVVVPFGTTMFTSHVDTSSGGFQSKPNYTARLVGPRTFTFVPAAGGASQPFVMDALVSVPNDVKLTKSGFTIQIFPVIASANGAPSASDIQKAVNQWTVSWMGVEG